MRVSCAFLSLATLAATLVLAAAGSAADDPEHAAKMAKGVDVFKKHVRPVLVQHCLKCHGGEITEGELDLTDRDRLLRGGLAGPALVPGKSQESLLFKMVSHAKKPYMPHKQPRLPAESIARIGEWIDLGAPYDRPLVGKEDALAWTQKVLAPEARQFWSFQPLRKSIALPTVKDGAWSKTPVDRFILARLEAAGIRPNPQAAKQQLIRRAYFDLVGLPPTPEAIAEFLRDDSPEAFGRVIDRLLDQPQYGERWARHWLDLARFAESHGFEHDYDRPTAYHYRDFVIEALNQDVPYTTFVKWQLAGDEYEPENNLALKATGYLAAGVHSTQITKNEVEKHRYDELDDILATTGTAVLGLTIGCARCHDHKFDPIPMRDYYRLLSAFTTTVRSEVDLNLDPEGYRKAKAAFDKEHEPFVAALKKYEAEELAAALGRWEKTLQPSSLVKWLTLDPATMKSDGGATLTRQDDASILATGKNAKFDTYTFTIEGEFGTIKAVRLEALADPSMVKGGPGRAGNGNFALSDLKVTLTPLSPPSPATEKGETGGEKGKQARAPTPLKLARPRATFEQKGLPVAAVIDADPKSAWAVDPQFGKDHAAVFEVEPPVQVEGKARLTITLAFRNNDGHNLGRVRLSVASGGEIPELTAAGFPQRVLDLLKVPAAQRSTEQTAMLLKWYRTFDPGWSRLNKAAQEHLARAPKPSLVKALISTEGLPAVRLHTQGGDFLEQTHYLRRGDPNQKEGVAPLGFLQVLTPAPDAEKRWITPPPTGCRTSYRRRALAEWITDMEQGAGNLLARVIVNRLWQHHMGRGIVATPSDFGTRGEPPTHPELLDWLAQELIRNGWRLKPIHKLIMTSAVYQQASTADEARAKIDRDNKLCWRRPVRRLESEVIRDSMLSLSGLLDPKLYGPGTLDENSKRRSIYFTVKRSKLMPMMVVFDAPEALSSIGERPSTTIAPQALMLMNNPQVRNYARHFARRVSGNGKDSPAGMVKSAYVMALAREPTADELTEGLAFLTEQAATYRAAGKADGAELALADFCQTLLCLNEFVYIE